MNTRCAATATVVIANCLSLAIAGQVRAQAMPVDPGQGTRLDALQEEVQEQTRRLDGLRDLLIEQQDRVTELQRALDEERLGSTRARGTQEGSGQGTREPPQVAQDEAVPEEAQPGQARQADATAVAQPGGTAQAPTQPVGRAPEQSLRPPEVAQIFDQPGVLTPEGTFILEPSLQFGYSSSNRVALVGYTIIPAILIGLIDVRQVKTSTGTAALTGRYGVNKRFELEARVPYVYSSSDTVSREIFTGSAVENVFTSSGKGVGMTRDTPDMTLTARVPITF